MKREFPFSLAIFAALIAHLLLGFVMKRHGILIAASPIPVPKPPMTVRFVEVPPGAKPVQKTPATRNFSENNYKAGSLNPVKGSTMRPGKQTPAARAPRTTPSPKPAQNDASKASASKASAPNSVGSNPTANQNIVPVLPSPSQQQSTGISTGSSKKLSSSLQDLNQFIQPGGSSTEGSEGDGIPGEDPGSGVFFDTQGFDLGPWAGKVVAIVKRNWMVPVTADLGLKGIVGVSFQVDKNGRILNPKIISTSNIPSYDQAAVNALITSNPLPPLPADFPRPALPAVFRFYYNVPVPIE